MKRLITMFFLIIVAMVSLAASTKTATVKTGSTFLSTPLVFTAADTLNAEDTLNINITCEQHYPQMQNVTLSFDTVTATAGTPAIKAVLYGKTFAGDAYVKIADSVDWTAATGATPLAITATTANRYRYFQIQITASDATQTVYIDNVEFKTWFTGGQLSVTSITDGTASFSSGALTGATTGDFSGNVTIGGTLTNTGMITANGGVTLGAGDDLIGSSTSDIKINTSKFTVSGADGNTIIGGTLGVTGLVTASAGVNIGTSQAIVGTTAMTIGSNTQTIAINSSDWDIDATGICTNMGTYNGLTIANSIGRLVTTATANADSSVAGCILAAADQFVTVTSASADNVIVLPAASATTIGMKIEGWVGANGFELRVATAQAATVKINDVTTSVEAAIPATTLFKVVCVSATDWILTATDEKGAVITAIIPDTMALP